MISTQKSSRLAKKTSLSLIEKMTIDPIATALKLSMPSWPLQNAVAVNPFWNMRDQSFTEVMEELAPVLRSNLYLPLEYYLKKYSEGLITETALAQALESAKNRLIQVPESVDELLQLSSGESAVTRRVLTFAEACDQTEGTSWQRQLTDQSSKYAAAYFDDSQAVAPFPWRDLPMWKAWLAAQEFDRSMPTLGLHSWPRFVGSIMALEARQFIEHAIDGLHIYDPLERTRYLLRLLANGLGWSTQFSYCQWQRSLGYHETPQADPLEYLAMLVAYDFGLAKCLLPANSAASRTFAHSLAAASPESLARPHSFRLHELWQTAFETSYQTSVATQLKRPILANQRPRVQVVMCIDVRSEMLRRALEHTSHEIKTIGFAGFFGLPLDFQQGGNARMSHRLPVLLSPAFRVVESKPKSVLAKAQVKTISDAYFRNLRKSPLASFAYVELFGLGSLTKLIRQSFASWRKPTGAKGTPERFQVKGSLEAPRVDLERKVSTAAAVLGHMGLTRTFGRLIVLTGHGNAGTNNAFASSLDCGACGGHSGDINARLLADILNDQLVRAGLVDKGIPIPQDTFFVAAIHETISDSVHILDPKQVPESHADDLTKLLAEFDAASRAASTERQKSLSPWLDQSPERRQANWSEVRPEWGLAGNACFIVAPRALTEGVNLGGRAFLHDYDASRDTNFATLELIMTAPMVVTNWINLQYYASTVAPDVYGAGDKTLHNLVAERGVQEGNGGDLRVGLPFQSVHDGENFIHEPLRLSVFIAAPREALESIIAEHPVVRELIENQWLHLLHIDSHTGAVTQRLQGGLYSPVVTREVL